MRIGLARSGSKSGVYTRSYPCRETLSEPALDSAETRLGPSSASLDPLRASACTRSGAPSGSDIGSDLALPSRQATSTDAGNWCSTLHGTICHAQRSGRDFVNFHLHQHALQVRLIIFCFMRPSKKTPDTAPRLTVLPPQGRTYNTSASRQCFLVKPAAKLSKAEAADCAAEARGTKL